MINDYIKTVLVVKYNMDQVLSLILPVHQQNIFYKYVKTSISLYLFGEIGDLKMTIYKWFSVGFVKHIIWL